MPTKLHFFMFMILTDKTKQLGEQCGIKRNNCVDDLVCKKLDFLPYDCGNGVGVCDFPISSRRKKFSLF